MRDCDESREIVAELEKIGASPEVTHFVLANVIGYEVTFASAVQRVRRAREKRLRVARQERDKPRLMAECIATYRATCAYCEKPGATEQGWDGNPWELDRIRPGRLGGEYCEQNVCLCCHSCNQAKLGNYTFRPPLSLAQLKRRQQDAGPIFQSRAA